MKFKIQKNVYILKADSQYELAITFMRLQEFYESSFDDIRGHYFTVEQYMDRYAGEFGNFTYTSDWNGFNIPGEVAVRFFKEFKGELTKHEEELREILSPALGSTKKVRFYIIGVHGDNKDVLEHELGHAMFYLSAGFNAAMTNHLATIHPFIKKRIFTKLQKMGYGYNVLADEAQAYLSTSSLWYLLKKFKVIPFKAVLAMRETHRKFKNQRAAVEK